MQSVMGQDGVLFFLLGGVFLVVLYCTWGEPNSAYSRAQKYLSLIGGIGAIIASIYVYLN